MPLSTKALKQIVAVGVALALIVGTAIYLYVVERALRLRRGGRQRTKKSR